jgi:hypothetical protein
VSLQDHQDDVEYLGKYREMSLQGRQGDFEYHIQVSTSSCSGCTLYSRVPAVHPRQKLLGGSLEGPLNMVSMDTSTNKYINRPVFF